MILRLRPGYLRWQHSENADGRRKSERGGSESGKERLGNVSCCGDVARRRQNRRTDGKIENKKRKKKEKKKERMWDGVKGRDGVEKKQRRVRVGRQRKALFYFNGAVSWAARTKTKPPLRPATFVIQTPPFDTTTTGFCLIPYSWEIFLIRPFSPLSSLFPYSAANLGGWIRDYSTCADYCVFYHRDWRRIVMHVLTVTYVVPPVLRGSLVAFFGLSGCILNRRED